MNDERGLEQGFQLEHPPAGGTSREAGLEPLAQALFDDPGIDPETVAADFLNPGSYGAYSYMKG